MAELQAQQRRLTLARLEAREVVRHGLTRRFPWLTLPMPTWSAPGAGGHDCGQHLSCPLLPRPVVPYLDDRFAAGAARAVALL